MLRRFSILRREVIDVIDKKDALDLKPGLFVENIGVKAWQFQTDEQKLSSFNTWFTKQVDADVFGVNTALGQPWTSEYVDSAYKLGKFHAYEDVHKEALAGNLDFYKGTKSEFLRSAFAAPEAVSKVRLLALRTYDQLKGVTAQMGQQMSRLLAEGMVNGLGPRDIARKMSKEIENISKTRALRIARTETIYAHAEGQLDSFEKLGIEEVGIMAEWSTAGDDLVCPLCLPLEGVIMTIKEARGIIPRHPNCRCSWIPANVGEKGTGQKFSKQAIDKNISHSIKAETPSAKTLADAKAMSTWIMKDKKTIDKLYLKPQKIKAKAFPVPQPVIPGQVPVPYKPTLPTPIATAPVAPVLPVPSVIPPPKLVFPPVPKVPRVKPSASSPAPLPPPPVAPPPPVVEAPVSGTAIGSTGIDSGASPFARGSSFEVLPVKLGGSTGAKLVEVTENGRKIKYVMKGYNGNETQAKNEYLANRLYGLFKIDVPNSRLGIVDGKTVVFNEYISGLKEVGKLDAIEKALAFSKLEEGFIIDSWLANWDVAGLSLDNAAVAAGKVYRIDNGGSLLYRAQGTLKGHKFGSTVFEIETLKDASINPNTAKVFKNVTDEEIIKLIGKFENEANRTGLFYPHGLERLIKSAGFDEVTARELNKKLLDRFDYISNQKIHLEKVLAGKKEVATVGQKAAPGTVENKSAPWVGKKADNVYSTQNGLKGDVAFVQKTLSPGEISAVSDFTGSSYGSMNRKVLDGTITSRQQNLDTALHKLPGYEGITVRGSKEMPIDMWNKWKSGEWAQVDWACCASSSVSPGHEFPSTNGIAFVIHSKGRFGRYVAPISSVSSEKEVLFQRGTKFRVTGWAESKTGVGSRGHRRLLIVEEMEPGDSWPETQLAPKEYNAREVWRKHCSAARKAGYDVPKLEAE
jgi:SPP1 gp7 family putative phage head morphogenesis protein